jgi:hypothetical protein
MILSCILMIRHEHIYSAFTSRPISLLVLYDLELSQRLWNKIFSGCRPHQVAEWRRNQRFEDHLRPRPQGTEVAGVPIHVIYIPAWALCSLLRASQWGLVGGVKCLPRFTQLSDWIACSSQDTRPSWTWNHRLCWSFQWSVEFHLLPSRGSPNTCCLVQHVDTAEVNFNTGHCIDFSSTSVLDKTTGYMGHLMKEAIEIRLNTRNFNRDSGFMLSQAWYPVKNMLSYQKARQNRASTWLHPPVPTG